LEIERKRRERFPLFGVEVSFESFGKSEFDRFGFRDFNNLIGSWEFGFPSLPFYRFKYPESDKVNFISLFQLLFDGVAEDIYQLLNIFLVPPAPFCYFFD
jgi:hypothetical protein